MVYFNVEVGDAYVLNVSVTCAVSIGGGQSSADKIGSMCTLADKRLLHSSFTEVAMDLKPSSTSPS